MLSTGIHGYQQVINRLSTGYAQVIHRLGARAARGAGGGAAREWIGR